MNEPPLAEVACLIAELAEKLNVKNINTLPGAWVYDWKMPDGTRWRIASNGHRTPVSVEVAGEMGIESLPPFHHAVWRNGWLFGLFDAFNGTFMGEDGKGEDEFVAAITQHIASVK